MFGLGLGFSNKGLGVSASLGFYHSPPLKIVWTHRLNLTKLYYFISVLEQSRDGTLVTYTSELRLSSVENKDNGYYQCVAYSTHFAPVQSKMAQITVLGQCQMHINVVNTLMR